MALVNEEEDGREPLPTAPEKVRTDPPPPLQRIRRIEADADDVRSEVIKIGGKVSVLAAVVGSHPSIDAEGDELPGKGIAGDVASLKRALGKPPNPEQGFTGTGLHRTLDRIDRRLSVLERASKKSVAAALAGGGGAMAVFELLKQLGIIH